MEKASENHRNDGVQSECCSPRTKVNDLLHHQQSQLQSICTPDTAMKPSQIPNRFPPPPHLRRSLHFHQYNGPMQSFNMPSGHPPQPLCPPQPLQRPGPYHFAGFHHYTPFTDGNITNQHTLTLPWQHVPQLQHVNSMVPVHSTLVPVPIIPPQFQHTPVNNCYNSYPNFTSDVISHAKFSTSQRDPRLGSTDTLSSQGSKNLPGQDQNKVESTSRGSVPMTELHRPSQLPLVRGSVDSVSLQRSDSRSPSPSSSQALSSVCDRGRRVSYPSTTTTTSSQNQVHEQTLSNEKSQIDITNHGLQKRRRESSSDDDHTKKQCVQTLGSDQTPTTGHVPSPHPFSQKQLVLELSPKSTENLLQTESPPLKQATHIKSVPLKACTNQNPMGVKQACIKSMHSNMVILNSPPKKIEYLTKTHEESMKKDSSCTLISSSQKKNVCPAKDHTTPNMPKCLSKVEENKMDLNSLKTPQKVSLSCRKPHRQKKPVISDDLNDLFTPDPFTYVVNSGHKSLIVRPEEKAKINISDGGSTSISSNTETPVTKPCHKEKSPTWTLSSNTANSIISTPQSNNVQISLPKVILTRVKYDNLPHSSASSEKDEKHKAHGCTIEIDAAPASGRTSTSPTWTVKQSEDKKLIQEDSFDLDLDLNFDMLDLDVTKNSHSSDDDDDDEQLVSLQEIMTRKRKPSDTLEKEAFSEPITPEHIHHRRHHHVVSSNKTGSYKNSLDLMLKEINTSKKAKEMETQLLTVCQEDLLRIAEYEKAEESREEPILPEQQRFLQRFSLLSSAIREVPPGHVVFNLNNFGRIFDQNTLQLRQCMLSPQKTAQKALLWSSHAQLKLYINIGLFQAAYSCSPCPFQVTRFLFKMMSVHTDSTLSKKILQVLCEIAYAAASQRIDKKSNQTFKVWVPSLADLTLVFLNMGAPFVSLYPLENLQPPFTEGHLLDDVYIKSEYPTSQEPNTFPEHNCNNIFKYLSYCTGLCPRAYTDHELLLLLTVLGTVALESRLILETTVDLYPLLYRIINNIRDWDNMMPRICLTLTDLTDDHHNMCHLVQLLPDHSRGKLLRRHLSLSMISKLLDGSCSYKPKYKEIQLCDLRLYLSRMKPSSLLRTLSEGDEDMASLDQQAYYLCYSLLILVNEASNFLDLPAHQKEHLLLLSSELERHVKCHIRESEKCLYRTKVKDLVARIYTKWQRLLQRTRPLNGKLYDYWQPSQGDIASSQDIEEIESIQDNAKKDKGEVDETGAEMENKDDEDEVTEVEVTLNGPYEDTESTVEEASLINAAKEIVGEELIEEETRCNKENDTQVEEMDCEDGELGQLVPNAAKDTVKADKAISTLETHFDLDAEENGKDMTPEVDNSGNSLGGNALRQYL